MIRDQNPIVQAFLGSLVTWGLTALGAAGVFLLSSENRRLLDGSLGFAAGVMTAASFWSLLMPAIEIAEEQLKVWAFVPVAFGFIAGCAFLHVADFLVVRLGLKEGAEAFHLLSNVPSKDYSKRDYSDLDDKDDSSFPAESAHFQAKDGSNILLSDTRETSLRKRRTDDKESSDAACIGAARASSKGNSRAESWRRIMLLISAIVIHNIPEGLVVGVGFGAVGKSPSATFESACALAVGIGIQNFPEGLAVSLPLATFGYGKWRSFFYGQLSGMVEPVAAIFGSAAVTVVEPLLPYALSFAAGAMIFVVFDDIIPEAQLHGYGRTCTWGGIVGFIVMMSLDVGLG